MSELQRRLHWMRQGSAEFLAHLNGIPDSAFPAESTLPGWTTAHLVAHVGFNANALSRLAHGARTGVEARMYPNPEARNAEIEEGAKLSGAELRDFARESDERLETELTTLPEPAWEAKVVTAQGRTVSATEIPWMRTREVWIHAVDLGTGFDFGDFPADLLDALITDIVTLRNGREQPTAVLLEASDRDRTWQIGRNPVTVRGTAADLCRWLAGRGTRSIDADGAAPELGRWL
jgi:maleylpyruvate isomerase